MATLISRKFKTHSNIYVENRADRTLHVEIGIPENGTDMETGMLVLVPGYGGNMDSRVWKKMREEFCDKYNLITMQCDYFGNKYMHSILPETIKPLLELKCENLVQAIFRCEMEVDETEEEFNDMGIMQALDIVGGTLSTIKELNSMGYQFNVGKIILFGSSHGSYLSHLANTICPGLYQCILDISSYLSPYYLDDIRKVAVIKNNIKLEMDIKHMLNNHAEYRYRSELYDLRFLYKWIENNCKIIVFQGADDWMVSTEDKIAFVNSIKNAELMLIGKEDVDGILFKDASHGMQTNFFVFFEMVMPMIEKLFSKKSKITIPEYLVLGMEEPRMEITYESGLPELIYISR